MKEFGELLKAKRLAADKTLRELGAYVNFSVSYISDIEHGRKSVPDLETVRKMQEFLGVYDNSLVNLASKLRSKIPPELTQIFQERPQQMSELLYRLGDLPQEQLDEIYEKYGRRGPQ